jgi:phosphoglycolate phosphatase
VFIRFVDAKIHPPCANSQHNTRTTKEIMMKLVIFDLDGTLLDTREDIANACNHALRMCGYPEREVHEYNMLVGRGIANLFRGALPEESRSEDNLMKMRSFFGPYYNAHLADCTRPYQGIEELLRNLKSKGIHLAIVSNKYQEGTESIVSGYFKDYGFTSILGQREGVPTKPDPAMIWEAIDTIPGISKEEVLYCGDSDVDMQAGIAAGVKTIGVTWGFRTREELAAYSPFALVDTPEEIYKFASNSSDQ